MKSTTSTCCRMLLMATALALLAGTCRGAETSPGAHHRAPSDVQSPQQYEEIQREWDELLWHCRGLLPPRPVRRLGSEFLGKRSPSDGPSLMNAAVQWCSDEFAQDHWLCTCLFPTSDASEESEPGVEEALGSGDAARPTKRGLGAILLSGKRMNAKWINPINRRIMGSEFLGKRASPLGSEFLGKRASRPLGSEFLGKRSVVPPADGVVME